MPLKNIHTYLTHEELFGFKSSLKDVEQIIKSQVHIDLLLPILSQLASFRKGPFSSVFKNHFLKYVLSSVKHVDNDGSFSRSAEKRIKENALYSPQGILNVWKYVLVYGEQIPKTLLDRDIDRQYILSFLLCMNISDHLVDSSKSLTVRSFKIIYLIEVQNLKQHLLEHLKFIHRLLEINQDFMKKIFLISIPSLKKTMVIQ